MVPTLLEFKPSDKDMTSTICSAVIEFVGASPYLSGLSSFFKDPMFIGGSKKKPSFRITVEEAIVPGTECVVYLLHIIGNNDEVMINAAITFGIPRGFKLFWNPHTQELQINGFLGKFANDSREMTKSSLPEGTKQISFFNKFSGSLGILFSVEINGEIYLIATSKNSGTNTTAASFKRILTTILLPEVSTALFRLMVENNFTLNFEVMIQDQENQVHGASVLRETAILTCIAQGFRYSPSNPASKINYEGGNTIGMKYLSLDDVLSFGIEHILPVGELTTLSGTFEELEKFLVAYNMARDGLTYSGLLNLVSSCSCNLTITVKGGSIRHIEVSGEILEGNVMKFISSEGTILSIEKNKAPIYTSRTFVGRASIDKFRKMLEEKSKGSGLKYIMTSDDFKSPQFIEFLRDASTYFCKSWVLTPNGKAFWKSFIFRTSELYHKMVEPENPVAIHIRVADAVLAEAISKFGALEKAVSMGSIFGDFPNLSIPILLTDIPTVNEGSYTTTGGGMTFDLKSKLVFTPEHERSPGSITVVRGLPGSGKSNFLRKMVVAYAAVDKELIVASADFTMDTSSSVCKVPFNREFLGSAHQACQYQVELAIRAGKIVAVDNTSLIPKDINVYLTMAQRLGCKMYLVELSGNHGSIHNIPAIDMKRMVETYEQNPFDSLTYKSISSSGLYPKPAGKTMQIRIVVGDGKEICHITLAYEKVDKNFANADAWVPFIGTEVNVVYDTVHTLISADGLSRLVAVKTALTLPEGIPAIKANLHVTLECVGFKPIQSNDLVTSVNGMIGTTMTYPEYLDTSNTAPLSTTGMIMRIFS